MSLVTLVLGCFDITHAGHFDLFEQAKQRNSDLPNYLVVGLASDALVRAFKGEGRPIFAFEHRRALVEGCRWVDQVIQYGGSESNRETDAADQIKLIETVNPDIFCEGEGSHVLPGYFEEHGIKRVRLSRIDPKRVCTSYYFKKIQQLSEDRPTRPAPGDVSPFYFLYGEPSDESVSH